MLKCLIAIVVLTLLSVRTFELRAHQQKTLISPVSNHPGIYIHIPFCRRRCFYCDFPIQVVGNRESTIRNEGSAYINTLIDDIHNTMTGSSYKPLVDTIYFGGGTPSLLDTHRTFDKDYLTQLAGIGVSRLSLGLQSFNDKFLTACGRSHTLDETYQALECVHNSMFHSNFNIDIISSLPGMTLSDWEYTLHRAISVKSTHISVYDLQIEERTAFGKWYTPGIYPLPSEEVAANLYKKAAEILGGAGFEHYEVSNYAKPGRRSRHNQKYWSCTDVYGFGMGAASVIGGYRFTRPHSRVGYEEWVVNTPKRLNNKLGYLARDEHGLIEGVKEFNQVVKFTGILPNGAEGDLVSEVDLLERVMLSLRTRDGLCLTSISDSHDCSLDTDRADKKGTVDLIVKALKEYEQSGCVELFYNIEGEPIRVRLTDPEGFLISNSIISNVFAALDT